MSEDGNPKASGRLLSKVVKFITRPTTDWADLNRVDARDGEPSESSLALKEMIERKRRNDFVRRREFDLLRKIRRRQLTGAADAADLTSMASSQVSTQQEERRDMLERIDRIEAQMSDAWLDRPEAVAGQDPAEEGLAKVLSGADGTAAQRAFAPTTLETETAALKAVGLDAGAAPDAPAGEVLLAPWADPASGAGTDDTTEIESAADALVGPEIEEISIRFANGDIAGAEGALLEFLSEGGELCDDVEAWLTLFDLYRAAGEPDKFDGAAIAFVGRFGRSAPQWELVSSPGSEAMPITADGAMPAGAGAAAVQWSAPTVLGTQSVAALNAVLTRHAPPWRIDWRRIRSIEPAALPALLGVLQRWANEPVGLRFHGAEELLVVLAQQSPTDRRDVDPQWWAARLALLRVMNELDEFELVALNYCVTYEMSPPAWEEPHCEFAPMADSGETLPPRDAGDEPLATQAPRSDWGALPASGGEVARLELAGVLQDDALPALQPLVIGEQTRTIELSCRQLQRVDFGAAGTLLNWSAEQQGHGRRVVFRHVNRLVAAFFGVIGITESALVRRRVD